MPLLGALLIDLLGGIATWLAAYLTQKVAVTVALAAIVTGLILAIFVSMRLVLSGIGTGAGTISPMFGAGISMVISPRTASFISTYITFWVACELYKWKVNILQLWARTI